MFTVTVTVTFDIAINPLTRSNSFLSMSGVLFTDGNVLLAGYQPKQKNISGIGGKANPGETTHQTAMREMLEELFGYSILPADLLKDVQLTPERVLCSKDYVVYVYTFRDLDVILDVVRWHGIRSPYYQTLPLSCADLVFKRKTPPDAEITHLCILPCESQEISPDLLSDISGLR